LSKFSAQKGNEAVNQCFYDSITAGLVGCGFNFKFNVCLTKTIPRGSLNFKTLINSMTHHGHKQCNNLIATDFTMLEMERFKTISSILEAKLFHNDFTSDTSIATVHEGQSDSHHDNNSYLYGSWLSDTVSQGMLLASLNNDHCSSDGLVTQDHLVDPVYCKWEPTLANEFEDEDVISDVVNYLELSKSWTLCDAVQELHFVDSDNFDEDYTYDQSFIDNFFSSQNIGGQADADSIATLSTANSLTCDQATNTPSTNCSPDLFSVRKHIRLEGEQCTASTPATLPLSSLPGQLYEDESLNSPHLFGEIYCGNTPVRKMNTITDFTSPALC